MWKETVNCYWSCALWKQQHIWIRSSAKPAMNSAEDRLEKELNIGATGHGQYRNKHGFVFLIMNIHWLVVGYDNVWNFTSHSKRQSCSDNSKSGTHLAELRVFSSASEPIVEELPLVLARNSVCIPLKYQHQAPPQRHSVLSSQLYLPLCYCTQELSCCEYRIARVVEVTNWNNEDQVRQNRLKYTHDRFRRKRKSVLHSMSLAASSRTKCRMSQWKTKMFRCSKSSAKDDKISSTIRDSVLQCSRERDILSQFGDISCV